MSWKTHHSEMDFPVLQLGNNETATCYYDQDVFKHPITSVQYAVCVTGDAKPFLLEADEMLLYRLRNIKQPFPLLIAVTNTGVSAQDPIWSVQFHLPNSWDADEKGDVTPDDYATEALAVADADPNVTATNRRVEAL